MPREHASLTHCVGSTAFASRNRARASAHTEAVPSAFMAMALPLPQNAWLGIVALKKRVPPSAWTYEKSCSSPAAAPGGTVRICSLPSTVHRKVDVL